MQQQLEQRQREGKGALRSNRTARSMAFPVQAACVDARLGNARCVGLTALAALPPPLLIQCLSLLDARSLGAVGSVAGGGSLSDSPDRSPFRCAAHDNALWKALCMQENWASADQQRVGAAIGWRKVHRDASEARVRVARFQLAMMTGRTARCVRGACLDIGKSKCQLLPVLDETPFNFVSFMEKRLTGPLPAQYVAAADDDDDNDDNDDGTPRLATHSKDLRDTQEASAAQNTAITTTGSTTTTGIVTSDRQLSLRQGSCTWSVLCK